VDLSECVDGTFELKCCESHSVHACGRGFIAEKLEVDKPEALPLAGLEAGLKRMGLDDDVVAKLGPAPETDLDEDEERATFEA
jgi:hypothetical protein